MTRLKRKPVAPGVQKKGLAPWATPPFHQFIEYTRQESQLLRLAQSSIVRTSGMVPLAEALHDLDKLDRKRAPRGSVQRLKATKKEAELARNEVDHGFPLLNAHALV